METLFILVFMLFIFAMLHRVSIAKLNSLDWREMASQKPRKFRILTRLQYKMAPLHIMAGFIEGMVVLWMGWILAHAPCPAWLCWLAFGGIYLVLLGLLSFIISEDGAKKFLDTLFPLDTLLVYPILWILPASYEENPEENEMEDEEISAYIDFGRDEGIVEPEMETMLEAVVEFQNTLVREVMTPRLDMVTCSIGQSPEEIAELFMTHRFSRLPVTGESLDDIRGILHIKDFFSFLRNRQSGKLETLVHPPLYVPESMRVYDVLTQMKHSHQHMAIVLDEYGGTAGLITMDDLLEELVGEIGDEYEKEEEIYPVSEGVYRIDGKAHVDVLEDLFDIAIEDTEYDTIGGLLTTLFGRVPKEGEAIAFQGLRFLVKKADDRRVLWVQVSRQDEKSLYGNPDSHSG